MAWTSGTVDLPSFPLVRGGRVCKTAAGRSTGHVVELREVERLNPLEATLRVHLELRLDQFRSIEASQLDKDKAREALQVARIESRPAFRAEIPIKSLAGIGDLVERLRRTAQKREIILGYAEPRRRFAARRLLAVQAVTDSDEVGVFVERELHCTAGALSRVFLRHDQSSFAPVICGRQRRLSGSSTRGGRRPRQDASPFRRASRSARAVALDDGGFCPVMSRPS